MRRGLAVMLWLVGVGCVGCEPEVYRAETRLLPDGSVERSVYQPTARTPDGVSEGKYWKVTRSTGKPAERETQRVSLGELLSQPAPNAGQPGPSYFLATGQFATVQDIPHHLVFEAPKGMPDGRLVRTLERKDCGVVTQWTWEETLTDVVTLTDHRAARTEMADLAVNLGVAACAEIWGPDYDLQELEQWLRTDLTTCFHELGDVLLEMSLHREWLKCDSRANVVFQRRCVEVLKRHGLNLFDDQQKVLTEDVEVRKRIEEFVSRNLQQRVRDKQGKPIEPALLKDILGVFEGSPAQDRFHQAWERAMLTKFGTKEQADEHFDRQGIRILGLYHWPILRGSQEFYYEMTVPGIVVETNAQLVGDQTMRWTFPASAAFPLGHTMRAVVAVPDTAALVRHFPKAKLTSRESIVRYLDLIRAQPDLHAALNDLVLKQDSSAWDQWRSENSDQKKLFEILEP